MTYLVVYEKGEANWSAYSPDVPGCIAAAESLDELKKLFRESLELHLAGLREDGLPIPAPATVVGTESVST
ncbi:type II toxin-antitoxin system HicB family antitoxin [bacterium]|nr:type II toxin-antitoxin system HicB family antitoxin [bacterium]